MGLFNFLKKKSTPEPEPEGELEEEVVPPTYPSIVMEEWNTTLKGKRGGKLESLLMCYGDVEKTAIAKIVLQLVLTDAANPNGKVISELQEYEAPEFIEPEAEHIFNLIIDIPKDTPKSSADVKYTLQAVMELVSQTVKDSKEVTIS
jgi:hypothetical protein